MSLCVWQLDIDISYNLRRPTGDASNTVTALPCVGRSQYYLHNIIYILFAMANLVVSACLNKIPLRCFIMC